jgi:hypothetical protein
VLLGPVSGCAPFRFSFNKADKFFYLKQKHQKRQITLQRRPAGHKDPKIYDFTDLSVFLFLRARAGFMV